MTKSDFILFVLAVTASIHPAAAQNKRAITPADCVTVRDLQHDDSSWRSAIRISPDRSHVAYTVRSPNIGNNENEIELYIRRFPADPKNSGKPILVGKLSTVQWRPDSRNLTMLTKDDGQWMISQVDSETGHRQVLAKADKDIEEYAIDSSGRVIIYATKLRHSGTSEVLSAPEIASGYRIPFQRESHVSWETEDLFVMRQINGKWSKPELISLTSPLSGKAFTDMRYGNAPDLNPTFSPDGKTLLVSYWDFSNTMPDEWRNSAMMQFRNAAGVIQAFRIIVEYDLATGKTTISLKSPFIFSAPLWSPDSKFYVVAGRPPVSSDWEREAVKNNTLAHSTSARLFRVERSKGTVEQITPKLTFPWGGPLFWDNCGDVFAQVTAMDTISHYAKKNGEWQQVSSVQVPLPVVGDQIATDGVNVIGKFSDTTTPPELFAYHPGDKQVQVFAKLSPQFDDLMLARSQEVHWQTSTGFNATGLLLLPPDYVKGKRYPLVIQTKPFALTFVCGFGNYPSFAPQPTANAGMMYLGQIATKGSTQREDDFFPKGYPGFQGVGGLGEAAFAMDLWDSAVKALDQQGYIDSSRVGIIGFSRTGWYTEFILAHSKVPYRAATVADNVQYSLGEYWLSHDASTIKSSDQTYGGPPYGDTLKNWLDYSVSFNLDKIRAPLLMEQMGYERPYDNPSAPPINLAGAFEVFTGLNRLGKPVELYYYPNEDHTPYNPKARLATMQRNVDWYRFWLKNEEDPDPAKAEQYKRWRELRKLQEKNEATPTTIKP